MFFHLPSFLLGYAAGVATGVFLPRLRPIAVEVAAAAQRFGADVVAKAATLREDIEDLWAEARHRAKRPTKPEATQPEASA
ncbi:MAG TPA: hypothetical protein VMK12_25745 [Anaeromyxobacteraceae bacterium]|nr:hypothetical protein [Anaeromyxobacteraceae bacterium]